MKTRPYCRFAGTLAALFLFLAGCQTVREPVADAPTVVAAKESDERLKNFTTAIRLETVEHRAPQMRAHFIDVGQGSCTLLEFPCGAILIDAGGADSAQDTKNTQHLMDYLAAFFQRRTDLNKTFNAVIVTHPHVDHTFGIPSVFSAYKVRSFIDDGIYQKSSGARQVAGVRSMVSAGNINTKVRTVTMPEFDALPSATGITDRDIDSVACADCDPKIRVLHGGWADSTGNFNGTSTYSNANNNSIVVRVDFGGSSFLITGDLEEKGIQHVLQRYRGTKMLDADVYLVGHHGSHNATSQPFLDAITPKYAVIPVGHWTDGPSNPGDRFNTMAYGHPRSFIVKMLSDSIATKRTPAIDVQTAKGVFSYEPYRVTQGVYATGWDGDVVITAKLDGSMSVKTSGAKP